MGRQSESTAPFVGVVQTVEDGLKTFGTATSNYIAAVRSVDAALESLAVAFRQMTMGDVPPRLRDAVEAFGVAVASHAGGAAVRGARGSVSSRASRSNGAGGGEYTLEPYTNDFAKDVGGLVDKLKTLAKTAHKMREEHAKVQKNYTKARAEAEKIAGSDVKKNRNSSENPKYLKKVQKRDVLRADAERREQELLNVCNELQQRRVEAARQAMQAMSTSSTRYWEGMAQLMSSADGV